MFQIGAVVGEIWRIGSGEWADWQWRVGGSRRGKLDMCTHVCKFKAQVL